MKEYATPFSMLHAASLLSHTTRLSKFQQAIGRTVKANDSVVDLGTGSGVLALMAARAGASKVIALDVNEESLNYAKRAASMNGLDGMIEFVHGHFLDYKPHEKADVVICEMLSSMMLIEQQVIASHHAVQHILREDGVLLPQRARIFIAPISSKIPEERFSISGLKFPKVPQTASRNQFKEMADFQQVAVFDFTQPKLGEAVDAILKFRILSDSRVTGFAGAFQATLIDDIILEMEDGWKDLILPLESPIEVSEGDQLAVRVSFIPGQFDSLILEMLN